MIRLKMLALIAPVFVDVGWEVPTSIGAERGYVSNFLAVLYSCHCENGLLKNFYEMAAAALIYQTELFERGLHNTLMRSC